MSGDTMTGQEIIVPIQQLDPEDILGECNWMFEVENQDIEEPGQESVLVENENSEEENMATISTDSHPFLWQWSIFGWLNILECPKVTWFLIQQEMKVSNERNKVTVPLFQFPPLTN